MAGLVHKNIVVIMGPPGAGKTVQAELLARTYGWRHLSTGELLRQANDPVLDQQMAAGGLADTTKTQDLLLGAMGDVPAQTGIIVDGFPRMLEEAQWLDQTLAALGRGLRAVLFVEISQPEASRRLALRGRADDTPAAELERWHQYEVETEPVLQYFGQGGVLVKVDGVGTVDEVTRRLQDALK